MPTPIDERAESAPESGSVETSLDSDDLAARRTESTADVPRGPVRQVAIPDDLYRLIRLKAAIVGKDVDTWIVDLIREHDDHNPQPVRPLLVEGTSVQRQLTAGATERAAANGHAEVLEPETADTKDGESDAEPEEAPDEELDDTTLVLRAVRDSTLLADGNDFVGATDMLVLMNSEHGWSNSPAGHRRVRDALSAVRPALTTRSESIGGKQVKVYEAGRLRKAIDKHA